MSRGRRHDVADELDFRPQSGPGGQQGATVRSHPLDVAGESEDEVAGEDIDDQLPVADVIVDDLPELVESRPIGGAARVGRDSVATGRYVQIDDEGAVGALVVERRQGM